jgi:hypothetical protein
MKQLIQGILSEMNSISLAEMEEVNLMNRTDTKFYFHEKYLPKILQAIKDDYWVLEIENQRLMPYESEYFDTHDYQMLKWHQNGKLNRFKIRNRKYLVSGLSFLEIKKKNNKGFTEKTRIQNNKTTHLEENFINSNTPFSYQNLKPVISNKFHRIMLVNKNMSERVSIDLSVQFFKKNEATKKLDQLILLELKSEKQTGITKLQRELKKWHIHPQSFSKYITGMYMFHSDLKFNRFKSRFLRINKTIEKDLL